MKETKLKKYYKEYSKEEIQQGTQAWFDVRKLKFTASKASIITADGKGLDTLVNELLAEYYSSQQYNEFTNKYKNSAMQRGNDFEDTARMTYEFETGNTVKEVGFIERSEHIGCSPDGLISDDGIIEIKNHDDKVFIELIKTKRIDPVYIKQMQYQMWVTERKWCDYFGFNPNYSPNFYLERIYPDLDLHKKIEAGLESGIKKIKEGLSLLEGKLKVQEKIMAQPEFENNTQKDLFLFYGGLE